MFWSIAYAEGATQSAAQPSFLEMIFPFILIFMVFYFFIIRPKSKNLRQHQEFLKNMKVGDAIITSSGLLGMVKGISNAYILLEVADEVIIKILREHISGPQVALKSQGAVQALPADSKARSGSSHGHNANHSSNRKGKNQS